MPLNAAFASAVRENQEPWHLGCLISGEDSKWQEFRQEDRAFK